MHTLPARSPWSQIGLFTLAAVFMLACVLLYPPLCVPLALCMPLLACPAQARVGLWAALLLPLVPGIGALLAGGDSGLCLLLLPSPYLGLLWTHWARRRKLSFAMMSMGLSGILLFCQVLWWSGMLAKYGEGSLPGLAGHIVTSLSTLPTSGNLLVQLVQAGFLPLPEQFRQSMGIQLGGLTLLNPLLQADLLNALRFRLQDLLTRLAPAFLMQTSLVLGLCTALRTSKAFGRTNAQPIAILFRSGDKEIRRQILPYPLFRTLRFPREYRGHLLFLMLVSLLLSLLEGPFPALLSTLLYAAVSTVFSLLGASVLVFFVTRNHPRRAVLAGILAVLCGAVFPTLLLLLGVLDQFISLRSAAPYHQEEDSSK